MSTDLLLPRGYLSWSQVSCWITNRDRYVREYLEDGRKLQSRYLDFGGQFARLVERLCELEAGGLDRRGAIRELRKDHCIDDSMEAVLAALDVEGISEYQVGNSGREGDATPTCLVRGEVPVLAFLDKYVPRTGGIQEYKTGKAPWTLAKVQKHDQLPFYGVALKWSGKPLPPHADLHWVETRDAGGEPVDFWRDGAKIVSATGRIATFRREFDEREFSRMEDLIVRVAREISDEYRAHLSGL